MLEKKSGHVVNVASSAGIMGTSEPLPYVTSKFAVVGLSEALYGQLYNLGIKVSVIIPQYVKTNIFTKTKVKLPKKLVEDHGREKIEEIFNSIMEGMGKRGSSPDRVVKRYIAQIKDDLLYICESPNAATILASKGEPRKYEEFLVKFNENFKNSQKEVFLKYGINLDDYE
jgi:short-subunit dehydrogenase